MLFSVFIDCGLRFGADKWYESNVGLVHTPRRHGRFRDSPDNTMVDRVARWSCSAWSRRWVDQRTTPSSQGGSATSLMMLQVYGPWDVIETGDSIYQEYRMVLESPRGEGLYGHREAVCEAGMEHCSHDANRG